MGSIGSDLDGSFGTVPGTDSPGAAKMSEMAKAAGFANGPFASESYDAAALIMLAMQAAGSTDSADYAKKVMDVANAPGESDGFAPLVNHAITEQLNSLHCWARINWSNVEPVQSAD